MTKEVYVLDVEIVGDEIWFDGFAVAKILPECPASVRYDFERQLTPGAHSGPDFLED